MIDFAWIANWFYENPDRLALSILISVIIFAVIMIVAYTRGGIIEDQKREIEYLESLLKKNR